MKPKNAIDTLLDEAKEKAGFKADNELALEMGIKRQTISRYRKGICAPDDYAKSRIADLTGRSLQEVIARIELENEPNEEKRKYWQNFFKRLGGITASFIAAVIMIMTPYPAEAAPNEVKAPSLYIMSNSKYSSSTWPQSGIIAHESNYILRFSVHREPCRALF